MKNFIFALFFLSLANIFSQIAFATQTNRLIYHIKSISIKPSYYFYSMLHVNINLKHKKYFHKTTIASAPFMTKPPFYSKYRSQNLFNRIVGNLKNHLQKINSLVINKLYNFFDRTFLPEINKLANSTIFIPKQIGFNRKTSEAKIHTFFRKFGYDYTNISNDDFYCFT